MEKGMEMDIRKFATAMLEILPGFVKEMARRQMPPAVREGKLTIQQIFLLEYLTMKESSIMSELARYMHVSLSAVTGLIGRMVKSGLVRRHYDEKDRRVIIIKPTRKGRRIATEIRRMRYKFIMATFSKISEEERGAYLRIITKVYNILMQDKGRQP